MYTNIRSHSRKKNPYGRGSPSKITILLKSKFLGIYAFLIVAQPIFLRKFQI